MTGQEASPRTLWVALEHELVQADPRRLAALGRDQESWSRVRDELNGLIAGSLRQWWELYWRAAMNGLLGSEAKRWMVQVQPPR